MSIFRAAMAVMAVMNGASVSWDGYKTNSKPCTRHPPKQTAAERQEALAAAEAKRVRKAAKRCGGV